MTREDRRAYMRRYMKDYAERRRKNRGKALNPYYSMKRYSAKKFAALFLVQGPLNGGGTQEFV